MVISETVILNDTKFTKTYSDAGKYISRNGTLYAEAVDPLGSGREYEETDRFIETEPETVETKINKLKAEASKNSADIDFLAMMCDVDMEV